MMRALKFSSILILFSLLAASCGGEPAATAMPTTATVNELQGKVEIRQPDQSDFSAAQMGMLLKVNGQMRTGEDGRARLDLSTGTFMRIPPQTTFTLESNEETQQGFFTRIRLEAGRIWIGLQGGSMEIDTPSGVAAVRGSYLQVWIDPETLDVWVDCFEGWCLAENPAQSIDLVSGQGAILFHFDPTSSTPPPPPMLRYLTQEDINNFLQNNPELQSVMDSIIETASALPTLTPTSTGTPEIIEPATRCMQLTGPQNGANLPNNGAVNFEWSSHPGATYYLLNFSLPSGLPISFVTQATSHERYMESLYEGGTYSWEVTALDSASEPICTAGPYTFTKDTPPPTNTPTTTPTPVSTAPSGYGNMVFVWVEGPVNYVIDNPQFCVNFYGASISDPDGVVEAVLDFQILNGPSGSFQLGYDTDQFWYIYTYIDTTEMLGTDTVNWWISARDSLGNWASSNTYQFTDAVDCPAY